MSWYTLPLQRCIIALAFLQIVVTAAVASDASLRIRQTGASTGTLVTCVDYATIANLSTIGLNSTYRAAYLEASPDGTEHSAALLNDAEAKLPPLTKNEALNQQCGNLTTIALAEAASNFTRGIVAQYRITAKPGRMQQES
ncbi:hypothetical protein BR93DRAFT_942007 [Coniochaeta sp. PMI_546]|nr:hypothetical protein BR93DRAFT_942007 [Coniochaeta sp. PMI_546]